MNAAFWIASRQRKRGVVQVMRSKLMIAGMSLAMVLGANPAQARWIEAESAHFTLVGDVPEAVMRRRVERLERFDAVMRQIVPNATQTRLPVMLVDSVEDVRRLMNNPNGSVLAFFAPSPFGVFAVSPVQTTASGQINAETVLFHEYVHHMLLSTLDDPMPRWMSEGMAELFMNSRLEEDGAITIGLGNSVRAYSLTRLGRWDVERLFNSDRDPPSVRDVDQLYAKGWLVLHYLLMSGKRPGEFAKFTAALKAGHSQMDAARAAFGDLGKLETELEFYRQRKELPALRVAAAQLNESKDVVFRTLDEGEAQIMPHRLQSMVGVTPKTAPVVVAAARPVAARFADNAFVQRALAEMEYDARNYDLADAAINRALAADPNYVDALCIKGLLVGARAKRDGNPALWREARSWILKANRLSPDTALPFVLYFDSFAAAGARPPQSAVDGLMRAIMLQPTYQDLRVKVALHLIATGDAVKAREVLAPVALSPHRKPDNPLALLIEEIDKGTRGEALSAKVTEFKAAADNLFVQPQPTDAASNKPA